MKVNEYGHWTDLPHWRALPVHFICDESVRLSATLATTWMGWPISANGYRWSADNQAEIDAGWIIKADTIEELAEKIGRDPETLKATIDRYNEMVEKGVDEDFGRDPETMAKIDEGPFYAVELTPAVVATTGGARRNTHSRRSTGTTSRSPASTAWASWAATSPTSIKTASSSTNASPPPCRSAAYLRRGRAL